MKFTNYRNYNNAIDITYLVAPSIERIWNMEYLLYAPLVRQPHFRKFFIIEKYQIRKNFINFPLYITNALQEKSLHNENGCKYLKTTDKHLLNHQKFS